MKSLSRYKLLVLDLDGTLYYQLPVKIYMALWLMIYYMFHPFRIRELFALRKFRQLREQRFGTDTENFYNTQLMQISQLYHIKSDEIELLINSWMIIKPLKIIKFCRRRKLLAILEKCRHSGIQIVVYSDYPVNEKLEALNFFPDYQFCSSDELINCMKPDSQGLTNIIAFMNLNKNEVLYIGDRDDRDGICAKSAGVDYIDVRIFEKVCYFDNKEQL